LRKRQGFSGWIGAWRWFGALCLAASLLAGAARAETRVALVIGNGDYAAAPKLANPPNDAKDVGAKLASLGFTVTTLTDLDEKAMSRAIDEFGRASLNADVSLFYYGGHGLQVAAHNFLIPVDAHLHSVADIERNTIHLDDVLATMEKGRGLHLIFLDACRTSPVKDNAAIAGGHGLARVGNAAGFLIAFATQPDAVAYDGDGRNSPFAEALLNHLDTKGQDISSMMIDVRKEVIASKGGAQVPWENSSLTRQFYFAPGDSADGAPETVLWRLAGRQRDPDLLRIYMDRFPNGPHVADARGLIDEFGKGDAPSIAVAPKENVEEILWGLARAGGQRALLDLYLTRYPSGVHAPEAAALRATLPDLQSGDAPPGVVCERLATHPRDASANNPGVEFETLRANAEAAINACHAAAAAHPDIAHYVALEARATAAAGRLDDAIALFRKAADGGDARAMVTLGLMLDEGDGMPKDHVAANGYYEKAAARGSPDGAIDLALALLSGSGVERDTARAISLLRGAMQMNSGIAAFDLGVLAQDGKAGRPSEALDFFRKASDFGDPRGYRAAAILLDEGRGVPKDPVGAADLLLRGVAGDSGESFAQLTGKAALWSPATVKALQQTLKDAGYFSGPVDGKSGPALAPALRQWRLLGAPTRSLSAARGAP
jgi:tetratricopeptide (TPR) repeat protein